MSFLYQRTYSDAIQYSSFEERFNYLALKQTAFSFDINNGRSIKQTLYRSAKWKAFARKIILRDKGCELAFPYMPISDSIYVHHLNPVTADDIINDSNKIYDPENVICTSYIVHFALHYADFSYIKKRLLPEARLLSERSKNDTCPWKNMEEYK